MDPTTIWYWLTPSLLTLLIYGIGQGLVKKWIEDVPPAKFCLYFVIAKIICNLTFFFTHPEHPHPFAPENRMFLQYALLAFALNGVAWILYFESIMAGPISIVGTLSATYPALTVLFAALFLREKLAILQYAGVVLVIGGCLGLAYSPPDPQGKVTSKRWMLFAFLALMMWGTSGVVLKYAYDNLEGTSEVNATLFDTLGSAMTLGVYGLVGLYRGKWKSSSETRQDPWLTATVHSLLPVLMMALGDLGVIIATQRGPVSLVTPITAAYPIVTLIFARIVLKERIFFYQWLCFVLILCGIIYSSAPYEAIKLYQRLGLNI